MLRDLLTLEWLHRLLEVSLLLFKHLSELMLSNRHLFVFVPHIKVEGLWNCDIELLSVGKSILASNFLNFLLLPVYAFLPNHLTELFIT